MSFRITGLPPEPFRHLYGLPDAELATLGARRVIADSQPGYPDRIEMRDVRPGEALILVNYTHQPAATPFRSSHAIFVREGAERTYDAVDVLPEPLRLRPIALRAFDHDHFMIDAGLAECQGVEILIGRLLANPKAVYLQAHYASRGCYAARIVRA
ncbi:DUF1203 domain-containing protein [Marinivivus vitaminiproducens]|uniref:DUF1203 domain-containing protein n=1 Tax=Marinivivus vitaminiproducens TaxID=3035935 RepID=UPI0027A91D4A|nr:DUF1203 domain-containing protein [Geminicoccaceae bacterium SCSIO 64248]